VGYVLEGSVLKQEKGEGLKSLNEVYKIYFLTPELKKYIKRLEIAYNEAGMEGMIKYFMEIEQKLPYPDYGNIALHFAQLKTMKKHWDILKRHMKNMH
jgi:hypothetical protein